jgi:hypothetical protein
VKDVRADHLRNGSVKSCGCLARELTSARNKASAKHGRTGRSDPTYSSWQSMKTRCTNPRSEQYPTYGGRGIRVTPAWLDFSAFIADMGERPPGTTLDRWPNVNGDYEPGNCRWATMREQENNKRNNVLVTHEGRTQTVAEWAREKGLVYQTLRARLRGGWTTAEAMTFTVSRRPRWERAAPDCSGATAAKNRPTEPAPPLQRQA